jgi:hypothetical protein
VRVAIGFDINRGVLGRKVFGGHGGKVVVSIVRVRKQWDTMRVELLFQ